MKKMPVSQLLIVLAFMPMPSQDSQSSDDGDAYWPEIAERLAKQLRIVWCLLKAGKGKLDDAIGLRALGLGVNRPGFAGGSNS